MQKFTRKALQQAVLAIISARAELPLMDCDMSVRLFPLPSPKGEPVFEKTDDSLKFDDLNMVELAIELSEGLDIDPGDIPDEVCHPESPQCWQTVSDVVTAITAIAESHNAILEEENVIEKELATEVAWSFRTT